MAALGSAWTWESASATSSAWETPVRKRRTNYSDDERDDDREEILYMFCPFWRQFTERLGFRSISWDWVDLTVAGDTLEPVRDAAGRWSLVPKKRKDISLEDSSITTTPIAELQWLLYRAISQLPLLSVQSKERAQMIIDADIDNFHTFMEKTRRDWKLYHIYSFEISEIVEHDSTIDSVMEKVPKHIIQAIPEHQTRIRMLVDVVRDWRKDELLYRFSLFLLECQVVEVNASVEKNLENIKKTSGFNDKKFGDIPLPELTDILEQYLNCMMRRKYLKVEPNICFRRRIESKHQRDLKAYWKRRDGVLRGSWCPVHFLSYLEYTRDYAIRHPLVELAKLWVYFYRFDLESELSGWNSRIKFNVFDH